MKAAVQTLDKVIRPSRVKKGSNPTLYSHECNGPEGSYSYRELPLTGTKWDANTLYVVGTNAEGDVVVKGTRSTFDAHKDHHIMESALELSQAVELRGVQFAEHQLGALLVRPAPAKPETQGGDVEKKAYCLSHISDLASMNADDVLAFAAALPSLVAALKVTKQACEAEGVDIKTVMPTLLYVADYDDSFELRAENGQSKKYDGSVLQTAAALMGATSESVR
jgi:hypothetical protein